MDTNTYLCLRQRNTNENGATALAMVAAHLQAPIGLREMRMLGGLHTRWSLAAMLGAAQRFGFQAIPLEGAYEDLPSLTLPAIAVFNQQDEEHYTVLYEVDGHNAVVADPASGLATLSKAQFKARWTGDVVALTRDEDAEEAALAELKTYRRPGLRLLFGAGLAFTALLTGLTIAGALFGAQQPAPVLQVVRISLAVGLGCALWSALLNKACVACNRALQVAGGLPFAQVGLGVYTLLWAVALYQPNHSGLLAGLAAAAGVHAFLLGLLAKHRLVCWSCVVAGSAVGLATVAALLVAPASTRLLMGLMGLGVLGLTWGSVHLARKVTHWRLAAESQQLAWSVAQEPHTVPEGHVHLVAYKRRGCKACAVFESVYAPALQEAFGETLTIEKRDAAQHTVYAPLLVIRGAFPVALTGLPPESPLETLHATIAGVQQGLLPRAQARQGLTLLKLTA